MAPCHDGFKLLPYVVSSHVSKVKMVRRTWLNWITCHRYIQKFRLDYERIEAERRAPSPRTGSRENGMRTGIGSAPQLRYT